MGNSIVRHFDKKTNRETDNVLHISIIGRKSLLIEIYEKVYDVTRNLHDVTGEPIGIDTKTLISSRRKWKEYPFREVTAEELSEYRKAGIPSFVLKDEGKYYYTTVPKNLNYNAKNLISCHLCGGDGRVCKRLNAASDLNGGCAKVRAKARCIELFPWITYGYETFNTRVDTFVVGSCEHFELDRREVTSISPLDMRDKKMSLAQFVFPEIESYSQYVKMMESIQRGDRYLPYF